MAEEESSLEPPYKLFLLLLNDQKAKGRERGSADVKVQKGNSDHNVLSIKREATRGVIKSHIPETPKSGRVTEVSWESQERCGCHTGGNFNLLHYQQVPPGSRGGRTECGLTCSTICSYGPVSKWCRPAQVHLQGEV